MQFQNELYLIDGGDHSFKVSKKQLTENGLTQDEAENLAVKAISSFVTRCLTAG